MLIKNFDTKKELFLDSFVIKKANALALYQFNILSQVEIVRILGHPFIHYCHLFSP